MLKLVNGARSTAWLSRRQVINFRHMSVSPFLLADIGEGIAEVELMKWFVKEGDHVKSFDKICEVQSDKATVEITSRYDGEIVKVHYLEGNIVKVGSALVDIKKALADGAHHPPVPAAAVPEPKAVPVPAPAAGAASHVVSPFLLADIGEGIAEVELMQWFVKEGDEIKAFDKICEVQSDKATVEITSRYDGQVVKVHSDVGEIVKVGSALVDIKRLQTGAEALSNAAHAVADAGPATSTTPTCPHAGAGTYRGGAVLTTPAVRKIAKENNISDLKAVAEKYATGPKGRLLKDDVRRFIREGGNLSLSAAITTPKAAEVVSSTTNDALSGRVESSTTTQVRGIQRLMVKSMTAANAIPTFMYGDEIQMDQMIAMRKLMIDSLHKTVLKDVKLSFMPFILKAISLALNEYPVLNSSVNSDCSEITTYSHHHIGVAMDTPKGLIVPVVKHVQDKSLAEIAKDLNILQAAAAKGQLTEAQLSGGTFSISNIGSIGGTYMVPILVVPQVMIGAIGKFQTLPKYVKKGSLKEASMKDIAEGDAEVMPRTVMQVSWSADHRIIDGATAARFSNSWKSFMENPSVMMASMR